MRFIFSKSTLLKLALLVLLVCFSCGNKNETKALSLSEKVEPIAAIEKIRPGIQSLEVYMTLLKNKTVGVVGNQTSVFWERIGSIALDTTHMHLVDYLVSKEVNVQKVFAPEHGFRGKADAGEIIKDGKDLKTGLPIISLYGKNKKPSQEQLSDLDILVFDIQDVGARFYTYISTLHYVMEACAEAGITLLVLDRPNPNGHYIDGPVLESEHASFVGMHPVPVVYGMTIGEYAQMINGEGWLKNKVTCDLTVIPIENYTHQSTYYLPIKPSPNLPNGRSINLYPSLCFFEGTVVSAGRGTDMQFQVFGAPQLPPKDFAFQFTPAANQGAKYPKFKDQQCFGKDLRNSASLNKINLKWLIEAYNAYPEKDTFFNNFLVKLAGTDTLQQQIEAGMSAEAIRASWQKDLEDFKKVRAKYLLYD